MVFYFRCHDLVIYMGRDKYENEELIAHGWPEDVWFHVDDLSSAHVYLRLPRGPLRAQFRSTGTLEHLPSVLKECCALVKANSIEGSKKHQVSVVYTPWENLVKRSDMEVGQVGFKDQKAVVTVRNVVRDRDIVKALDKTRTESYPDLKAEREARDAQVRANQKARAREARKLQRQDDEKKRQEAEERSYDRLFANVQSETVVASVDDSAALEAEDDFM